MPRSEAARDFDLYLKERNGMISKYESKAISLHRDLKDDKKTIIYSVALYIELIILGDMFKIPVYLTASFFAFLLFCECYALWIKSAEVETDIKYLEAGLKLIRN